MPPLQILLIITAALLILAVFLALREPLTRVFYAISSKKVKRGHRFLLITDLHSTRYGKNGEKLLAVIRREKPEALLFAGDIVDDRKPRDEVYALLRAMAKQFPCYYATGNHEYYKKDADVIKRDLRAIGFHVLSGAGEIFSAAGDAVFIAGVDDPERYNKTPNHHDRTIDAAWTKQMQDAKKSCPHGMFSILLSHRPELASYYEKSGFDLVLSGHAHGGQARIPFLVNGLYAPHQGLFPPYAGGRYNLGETTLIVSRGLCKNAIPRIFNPPEYIVLEIGNEK